MNPDQLIQLLIQMLGNQVQVNPGSPLGVQMTDVGLSFLMPEGPGRELLSQTLGPEVNKALFGTGPLAGYGGINSQWNLSTRLTQYHQEQLVQRFKDSAKFEVQKETERQYLDMMARRMGIREGASGLSGQQREALVSGESTDWRYLMMRTANAITMPEQVAYGVRDLLPTQGYMFGAGVVGGNQFLNRNTKLEEYTVGKMEYDTASGTYKAVSTRDRVGIDPRTGRQYQMADPLSKMLTDDFIQRGYLYGGLNSTDIRSLTSEMGRRGEIRIDTNEAWDKTETGQAEKIRTRIQDTSRAVAGIRDIIKGDLPEMMRQFEAAFGGETINNIKIQGVARGIQQYRQLAESTGTDIMDILQYSQAANRMSQQIGGFSLGPDVGLSIGARMAVPQGDMRGIDSAKYAQTVSERVTGARMSRTSMMVSGALEILQSRGASPEALEKFKAAVTSGNESMNSETIARLASEALGSQVSQRDVIGASQGRAARDIMTTDPTGERAAMANLQGTQMSRRKNVIRSLLGITDDAELDILKTMNTREMEEELKKKGLYQGREGSLGRLATALDSEARSFGFRHGEEEQAAFWRTNKESQVYADMSKAKAEFAEAFQFGGGGIAGVVRELGAGRMTDVPFKEAMGKFFNVINASKVIDPNRKTLMAKYFGSKDSLGIMSLMDLMKSGGPNDVYADKMEAWGNEEFTETLKFLGSEQDLTEEKVRSRIGAMSRNVLEKKKKYAESLEGTISAEKGKQWDLLTTEEKREGLKEHMKKKAEAILHDSTLKSSIDTATEEKLKEIARTGGEGLDRTELMKSEKFKKLLFGEEKYRDKEGNEQTRIRDEAGAELFTKGVPVTMVEYLKEIKDMISGFLKSNQNKGSNEFKWPWEK